MPSYKAIAAMSENRVIGTNNSIPWHLPEDFKWFKKTTMGAILVMGRKTYESIGRPLPGRETIVISRSLQQIEGVQIISNLEKLHTLEIQKNIWIAGGGEIYRALLPHCSELLLTRVHRTVEGDAYFPKFESEFQLVEKPLDNEDFTVERWIRSE